MAKKETILATIAKSLENLASVRDQTGRWIDTEREEEEESCVFKIMEAIEPFFLANYLLPTEFARLKIPENVLFDDFKFIIKIIENEGFSPSPYLYVREKAELIDSAALAIRIMLLASQYIGNSILKNDPNWKNHLEKIPIIIGKAFNFILKSGLKDKNGIRWAGTPLHSLRKTIYCNVYFTSQAIKALTMLKSSKEIKGINYDELVDSINEGCRWLLGRVKENIIYGDEIKTKSELNFSYYALDALFESYDLLEDRQKNIVRGIYNKFVDRVANGEEGLPLLNYFDVPLIGLAKPIYYDDRSSLSNILTVLCKGRNIFRDETFINERFFNILNIWYRLVLNNQNTESLLWDRGNFQICFTARGIEALLYFFKYGKAVNFILSEQVLLQAIKNTLSSPQIQNVFLRELSRLATPTTEEAEK